LISCRDFLAEVSNYLEGDVGAEVRLELERHLAHCESCQVVYDSTRKTLRIVTESGMFELPKPAFGRIAERVMARIRNPAG